MNIPFHFVLFLLFPLIPSIYSELIFVFEHFRHGARGSVIIPQINFIDRYNIEWEGNGELSKAGMRMHYLIGVRNRKKYQNFLSQKYEPKEILVMSTDQNRTILSAQAQLLGMFPPESGIELTEEEVKIALPKNPITKEMQDAMNTLKYNAMPQKIQLIPIHSFGEEEKYYLLTEPSACPAMGHIKQKYEKKKIIKDFYDDFNKTYGIKLMNFFKKNSTDFLFVYFNMLAVTDHFISSFTHGKNLDKVKEAGINLKEFFNKCKEFKYLSVTQIESDDNIGVMAASPTMKKIIMWMENSIIQDIENDETIDYSNPKYVMYSGHDYTVVPMEQFLNKGFGTDVHYPEFAANQFFELYRMDGVPRNELNHSHYYVEYYYNDILGFNVTFDDFKRKVEEIAWSLKTINNFCKVNRFNMVRITLYVVISFSFILILYIIRYQRRKFYSNKYKENFEEESNKKEEEYGNQENLV